MVAIACPERFVVGLDISDSAIKKAEEVMQFFGSFFFCKVQYLSKTKLNGKS